MTIIQNLIIKQCDFEKNGKAPTWSIHSKIKVSVMIFRLRMTFRFRLHELACHVFMANLYMHAKINKSISISHKNFLKFRKFWATVQKGKMWVASGGI